MRKTDKPIIALTAVLILILTAALLIKAAPTSTPNAAPEQREGSDIPSPTSSIINQKSEISPPSTTLAPNAVRGVNYAHIHRNNKGYGSDASKRELTNLQNLGIDWIAITPFGYQSSADQNQIAGYDPNQPLSAFTTTPPPFSPVARDRSPSPLHQSALTHQTSPRPSSTSALSTHTSALTPRPGQDRSLTDRHLAEQVAAAHRLGVKVLIKPHIWSRDFWNGDAWHGTIEQNSPKDHESWRKSYLRFILHHAQLAQDTNAEALCIGTELISQTTHHPDDWLTLIREVKKIYSGKLTYAAHWDQEFQAITFWDQLDAIGISAYFPLDAPDNATVKQLVDAWQPHKKRIEAAHTLYNKPVVFLEIGYRPATGTYRQPWLDRGGQPDPIAQARAYEALFQTYADEPWWHGLFIWKVFTDAQRSDHHGTGPGYSFRNQPAEQVIQQWFRQP